MLTKHWGVANHQFQKHPSVILKFSLNLEALVTPLKGQSYEIFAPSFIHQSVHSGPIRDVHGPFYFFLLFHRVIALLKRLPGTLETGESLFFYLDLDMLSNVLI